MHTLTSPGTHTCCQARPTTNTQLLYSPKLASLKILTEKQHLESWAGVRWEWGIEGQLYLLLPTLDRDQRTEALGAGERTGQIDMLVRGG